AAAALATQRLGAPAHQVDGVEAGGEIRRHAHHHAGLAVTGHPDDGDHARADLLLALVGETPEVLEVDPLDRARDQVDVADLAHPAAAARPAAAHAAFLARLRE